jgi:hypothetical protein
MNKIMVLCLIVALAFGASGATCMQNVQTQACNPPAAVTAVITGIVELAKFAVSTFVPGTQEYMDAVSAEATATAIEAGVCISTTQLNNLIAWVNSMSSKAAQNKMMVKAGPMRAKVVNVAPLQAWADTFK